MQINIPEDLTERIRQRTTASPGVTEADVIRKALDSLDWNDAERAAIQAGIDAVNGGRARPFEDFDREFRQEHNIAPDA